MQPSFTVNDDTSITAVTPAGSAGAVDVTVVAPGGTSAIGSSDQFTYQTQSTPGGTTGSGGGTTGTGGGPPTTGGSTSQPASCTISSTGRLALSHPARRGRRSSHASAGAARLAISLTCDESAQVRIVAVLTDTVASGAHHRARARSFRLSTVHGAARAGVALALRLTLPAAVVNDLLRGARQSISVRVLAANTNGHGTSSGTVGPLTH